VVYEVLKCLHRQRLMLRPTTNRDRIRLPGERNLEVFRLRVVEGRTLKDTAQQLGIGTERVRQILAFYFGLHGEPPAVKARPRRTVCRTHVQVGRAIQRLRVAKGLTIETVADTTAMTTEQVARIEDGLRDPTWTTLAKLAVAFDTTVALLAYAIEVEKP
jgi:DNA-binding XRE family transcriptional regulator